jgi:hypothetical protein
MARTHKDRNKEFSVRKGIPSSFKAKTRRQRRRKAQDAMRKGCEIPRFRTSDHWNWW